MMVCPHSPAKGIANTAIKIAILSMNATYTKGGPIG
jgi:hypothetical protein